MYDELVKRLRAAAKEWREKNKVVGVGETRYDFALDEAADVIEDLSKYADAIRKLKCEGWYLQRTKYRDGYQAVSAMPLPEPPKGE